MTPETSITWAEKSGRSTGVIVQTQDWRLECNARGELFDCVKLERIWPSEKLKQLLADLISQHVPTWENALQTAEPPDRQVKQPESGYR